MLFLAHFHYSMKDILYITLKVQVAQNVSIQNGLKFFFFFTINGPAKTKPLPPALHNLLATIINTFFSLILIT